MAHLDSGGSSAEHRARGAIRGSLAMSWLMAMGLIFAALALSWLIVHVTGGANVIAPHFYYIPIIFAAARFGPLGALVVSLLSAILAGPLTYADAVTGTSQATVQWVTRGIFFVVVGQLIAWLAKPSLRPIADELRFIRQEYALRRALDNGEFFLVYQPIVSLGDNTYYGAEALLRWQHPTLGILTPGHFMETAEQSNLIWDITGFVIDESCRQAAKWRQVALERGLTPWHININVSGHDFNRQNFIGEITNSIAKHGLPPELVTIELTESVILIENVIAQLSELKKAGVKLAVDDFGTGYSSLSYLHKFPVDVLKIDRSLVADLNTTEESNRFAGGLVTLSTSLGLVAVAEGIEDVSQCDTGRELGFHCAQGYYLYRPAELFEIEELITHPQWIPN